MKKVYLAIAIICILFLAETAMAQFSVEDKVAEEMSEVPKANAKAGHSRGQYKRRAINDGDFVWGLSYNKFTDTINSPYKKSVDVYAIREILLADERLQLQFASQVGYMSEPRKEWFADAIASSKANVSSVPGTYRLGLNASLNAIILNRHVCGISVGPTAGMMFGYMPKVTTMNSSSSKYSQPLVFAPTMGIRANLYLFQNVYIGASYTNAIKSHFYNERESVTTKTPFSGNFYSLSIGIRGLGMPVGTYFIPEK